MALPQQGLITVSQINAEFSDGNSLGNYRGKHNLPNNIIKMSDFHGKAAISAYTTCKDWLDSGATTDGVYMINPTGNQEIETYCDMTTSGGGWTLVIGAGTAFGKAHAFWDGNGGTSSAHYYLESTLNTSASEVILKNMPFTELMIAYGDNKPVFTAGASSTFVDKKSAQTPFSGGNTWLNNLTWSRTDRDAYTYANFLLGGRTNQAPAYGDYYYVGAGVDSWASSLTTATRWFNGADLGYVTGTYHHTFGQVHHRSVSDTDTMGMFIR